VPFIKQFNATINEHHCKMTFPEELLRKPNLEWDERYVWD